MIKANFVELEFKGSEPMLLSELTVIIHKLKEIIATRHCEDFAREQINNAVRIALLTEEEIDKECNEAAKKIAGELIEKLFEGRM